MTPLLKADPEQPYNYTMSFIAACLGMFLFGVSIICLGSVMPYLVENYSLTDVQSGTLASVLASGLLVGTISFGIIVDQYGYKLLFVVTTLSIQVGLLGISYAGGLVSLFVCFFLIGAGGGAINGIVNALVSEISEDRGSSNLTFLGIFYGVGALVVPGILGVLSDSYDYTAILNGFGWFCVLPLVYFLLTKMPKRHVSEKPEWSSITGLLRERHLWLFALFLMFHSGLEGIVNNWSTLFMERAKELDNPGALGYLTLLVASLTVTRIVLGFVLRNQQGLPVIRLSLFCMVLGVLQIQWTGGKYLLMSGVVFLGIGMAASFPIILNYVGILYHRYRGTAFSIVLLLVVLGNIVFNFIMGLSFQKAGAQTFTWMIWTLWFCMIMVLVPISRIVQRMK